MGTVDENGQSRVEPGEAGKGRSGVELHYVSTPTPNTKLKTPQNVRLADHMTRKYAVRRLLHPQRRTPIDER
jgi:hypothetical protein